MTIVNLMEMVEMCKEITTPEPSTYHNWLKAIKPIAHMNVQEINKRATLDYRIKQRKPKGPLCDTTYKQRVNTLKGIWNTAIEWELIEGDNPWMGADIKLKRVVKRRRPKNHPWEFYERYHRNPRFRCLWFHGFRINELVGLYKENLVLDAPIPYFRLVHQDNRRLKNDESIREIPIHPACLTDVERLSFGRTAAAGWKWSQDFSNNLNLPPGDAAHSIRHSFKSRMNKAGIIHPIQLALMGHAPKSSDDDYGEVDLEMKLEALIKLT